MLVALGWLALGCAKSYPAGRSVVDSVKIENTQAIDAEELEEGLATAESPRFLGIWEGVVFDYEVYDKEHQANNANSRGRHSPSASHWETVVA